MVVTATGGGFVPFENNARLDPSQVEDARGSTGGSIGGLGGGPGPMIVGGGGLGLVVLIAYVLLSVLSPGGLSSAPSAAPATDPNQSVQDCQTGADANNRTDC